jgi:HlyD family secretion protein
LVILGGLVAAVIYAMLPQPVQVDTARVSRGELLVTIDEDGKTRIKERYFVSTPVGGRLERISFKPGDEVTASDTLLAVIQPSDPDLLDAREIALNQARVKAAESNLDRAIARREQAKVALDLAEANFGRASQLHATGAVPDEEFEISEAEYRTRSGLYRASQFEERIAQFELEQARAALLHVQGGVPLTEETPAADDGAAGGDVPAQPTGTTPPTGGDEAADTAPRPIKTSFEIHAPISGRVLNVMQESATVVTPGTALLELGDPADLEIVIDVLSSDAVKIPEHAEVILEEWGGNEPLKAIVRLVEPAAFTKISALGVEEQRVNVIADFRNPPADIDRLGDAYRVEARIVIWRGEDVLQIPTSALVRHGDEWSVFQIGPEGRAIRSSVKIGHRNDRMAQVLSGLTEGQDVVLYPSDLVREGVPLVARE